MISSAENIVKESKTEVHQSLQSANALGNDRQLWPHGVQDSHYWYSVLDGMVLLQGLRQQYFTFAQNVPADSFQATLENKERIFLADPYEIRNFQSTLENDICDITGTHSEDQTARNHLRWQHLPTTLIFPLLAGAHWRIVKVAIDYELNTASILWDDPRGPSSFPETLKHHIFTVLKKNISVLFDRANRQANVISFTEETKTIDQQGKENGWDCGPIVFTNIQNYLEAALFSKEVAYTLEATDTDGWLQSKQILLIRQKHADTYRHVSGFQGQSIPLKLKKQGDDLRERMLKHETSLISAPYVEELRWLLKEPYWLAIFHSYIENLRISDKNSALDALYTDEEIKKAKIFIINQQQETILNQNSTLHKRGMVNPFQWHIRKYYDAVITKVEKLDASLLASYLEMIEKKIRELESEGYFKEDEEAVRSYLFELLNEHLENNVLSEKVWEEEQEDLQSSINKANERAALEAQELSRQIEEDPDNEFYYREEYGEFFDDEESLNSDHSGQSEQSNDISYPSDNEEELEEDPFEGAQYKEWKKEKEKEIGNRNSLQNLINLCREEDEDNYGLGWLINQVVEYTLEVWEGVAHQLSIELPIDRDVLLGILGAMTLERCYNDQEIEKSFIANGFIDALIELRTLDETTLSETQKDNPFLLTKQSIIDAIHKNAAQMALIGAEKLQNFESQFNDAYHRNDWVEVQKLWAVFTKFQKLLVSSSEAKEKSRLYPTFKFGPEGEDYSFEKHQAPKNYKELLEKAWQQSEMRAENHYFRIYPHHQTTLLTYTSLKDPGKNATITLTELLGELENVGRKIEGCLRDQGEASGGKANILAPILCFVVSTQPHQKKGKHQRIFLPISLELLLDSIPNLLLSLDIKDGVFAYDDPNKAKQELKEQANRYYQMGRKIMGKTHSEEITHYPNKFLYHSEHVLVRILNSPEVVEHLVSTLLPQELEKYLGQALEEGKYKLYAVSMLTYSSNSICNICTPTLITLQNSYEDGFLKLFLEKVNGPESHFKTRGYHPESRLQDRSKFRMTTIVTADYPYTEQAYDLRDKAELSNIPKDSKKMHNPKAKIFFQHHAIDFHAAGRDLKGTALLNERSVIEFVGANFSEKRALLPVSTERPKFVCTSYGMMSGSKEEKFPGKVDQLNQTIREILKAKRQEKTQEDQSWRDKIIRKKKQEHQDEKEQQTRP